MGYTSLALKGFSWLTAFRVATRIVSLGKTAIVARFLSPAQFGLFGVATLLLSFVEVVTETGVNIFLVQQKEDIDEYLSTAWIVSIIRGTVIAFVMIISAPFIASFFKAPEAINLIYVMSIVPFLRGFINPAVVKFQKELQFQKEFYYRVSILLIEVIATILFLYFNPQPISLIWGLVIGVFLEVILSFFIISPRPTFSINKTYLYRIAHQGKWITGGVIFNYGFERGDDIAVGRVLGTPALGIYDMAYRFSMLPITEVANMVIRVVFPVFVKIADDYDRLKRAYFRTIGLVTLVVTPFGLFVFFFTDFIILLILGEKWIAAAPVLKVLALLGAVRAISLSISAILLALEKQKFLTITTCIGLIGLLITIFPFIYWFGIVGAAYAAFFGYMLSVPFIMYYSWMALEEVKKTKQHLSNAA